MLRSLVSRVFGNKQPSALSGSTHAGAQVSSEVEEVAIPLDQQIKELKAKVTQLENENYDLSVANETFRNKQQTAQPLDATETKEYYEDQIAGLTTEIEKLKAQNCALIKDKSATVAKLRAEMSKNHKEAEGSFTALRTNHAKEVSGYQKKIADQILEIGRLKEKLKPVTRTATGANVGELIEKAKQMRVRTSGSGSTTEKSSTGKPAFDDETVRLIRRKVNVEKVPASELATTYGVSASTITRCAKGETYVNVK